MEGGELIIYIYILHFGVLRLPKSIMALVGNTKMISAVIIPSRNAKAMPAYIDMFPSMNERNKRMSEKLHRNSLTVGSLPGCFKTKGKRISHRLFHSQVMSRLASNRTGPEPSRS
jgi:hypothetical protein